MPFRRKNCAKCPRNSWPPRSKRLQRMTASSITLLAQDWLCFHHKIYFTWKYCRNFPFAVILALQVKFYIKDWLWPSARVFHLMDKRSAMPAPCINLCLFWFYISLYLWPLPTLPDALAFRVGRPLKKHGQQVCFIARLSTVFSLKYSDVLKVYGFYLHLIASVPTHSFPKTFAQMF